MLVLMHFLVFGVSNRNLRKYPRKSPPEGGRLTKIPALWKFWLEFVTIFHSEVPIRNLCACRCV